MEGGFGLLADLLVDHAAVKQVNRAVGVAGESGVVGDHQDGGASLVERVEKVHDGVAVLGIQVSGGLVGQEHGGVSRKGPGDGDALLLAARKLGRQVFRAVAHANLFQGLGRALPPLRGGQSPVGQGQLDVLVDGQVADQVE